MDPYIHITHHKNGLKMSGFISINTSPGINPFCRVQCKKPGSICKSCYADDMERSYPRLKTRLIENTRRLSVPLNPGQIEDLTMEIRNLNRHYVRFNSLGELTGIHNLKNYYQICMEMGDLRFGIWSKRPALIRKIPAPENITRIYSNPVINKPIEKIPAGFTGVFDVVTYDHCLKTGLIPNCTGMCIRCLKCYSGDPAVVTELTKADQTRIKKGQIKPLEEVI